MSGFLDIQQINLAIGAHGQWKIRLRQAIEQGHCEQTVDEVQCDDHCVFGKWLYALPESQQGGDWQRVREFHATFHREAATVLALALGGKKAEAEQALGAGSKYSQASLLLTTAMLDWMNNAQGIA